MINFKVNPPLILIILLGLIIFTFAILIGGTMPYFILYVFLLAFTLPFIHSLIILRKLTGSVEIPEACLFTGDSITINYSIENNSLLPMPYLEVHSNILKELAGDNSNGLFLSLRRKESFTQKESITLKRRGYYELGDIEVTLHDVFGFYSFKKSLSNKISLLVYPEPISLSRFHIVTSQQSGEFFVHNSVFQDKSRTTSLRDYREGDSIKSIHWKLSAKRDNLIIKEYDNPGDNNVIIFMENNMRNFKNDIDRRLEDKSVDAALSIVNYCLEENIEVYLETENNQNFIEIQGSSELGLKPFLEVLARFKGNGSLDLQVHLMDKIHRFKKGSTIIVITTKLNKELGSLGVQLKTENLNPVFIVITDRPNKTGYLDLSVEDMLRKEGITLYILDCKTPIKEVLEVHYG